MNVSAVEACHKDLFTDFEELQKLYPQDTVEKIIRVRDMYLSYLKAPSSSDSSLIKSAVSKFGISRPTAYSDLAVVKSLLPLLGKEGREFHRWQAIEMLRETYRMAKAKMDPRTMERVVSSYAKITGADREPEQSFPVEQIIIQPWVPVDDPSVLGIEPMKDRDRKIRELLDEFRAKNPDIEDVQWEDADIDNDPLFPNPGNDESL